MKKLFSLLICAFCLTFTAAAQSDKLFQTVSANYKVYSNVSEEYTKEISLKMEACIKLFNSIFHFDLMKLTVKLKVVIFANQTGFNSYLTKIINQTRTDFVYIHYTDMVKSELVGYVKDDPSTFDALLIHQGLIQFLKAFVPTAPIWLQEGVAAYLESSAYNEEKSEFTLEKNLAWLDSLKAIIKGQGQDAYMTVDELITIEKQTAITKINTFYPEVWGLVYFLLNSEKKEYNRLLWDTISSLNPANTLKENSVQIKNDVFSWVDATTMETDFLAFIGSLKTFQDYIEDGINYFNNNELVKSKECFTSAKEIKPTDYFAYYYLGLIEYTNKEYFNAEVLYQQALSLGADQALTKYALGVNAYANNEFDAAKLYLGEAASLDAAKYSTKVQEILTRIEAEQLYSSDDLYITQPEKTNGDDKTKPATDSTIDMNTTGSSSSDIIIAP